MLLAVALVLIVLLPDAILAVTATQSKATAPDFFTIEFETTLASPRNVARFNINRTWAPIGVDHFYELMTTADYYSNNGFFRVVEGFVVQFGINGVPATSAKWENKQIQDDPVVVSNKRGTLVYATAGPNTRTTQLFVNYADNSGLDSQGFAPFGEVADDQSMQVMLSVFAGYAQQPNQSLIYSNGNKYLKQNFPQLTYIQKASIMTPSTTR